MTGVLFVIRGYIMSNQGSFGEAIGGGDALKQAMQRRGVDASILDQVSPAAPGQPSPVPTGVPTTNPAVGSIPQGPEQQMAPGQSFRSPEMEISLKALSNTIKTENKIAESATRGF